MSYTGTFQNLTPKEWGVNRRAWMGLFSTPSPLLQYALNPSSSVPEYVAHIRVQENELSFNGVSLDKYNTSDNLTQAVLCGSKLKHPQVASHR